MNIGAYSTNSHICDIWYLPRTRILSSPRAQGKYNVFDHLGDKTMLCFHCDLRARMIWLLMISHRGMKKKQQHTCPLHFLQVDSRPFSSPLSPSPFAVIMIDKIYIQDSRLKSHTFWSESFSFNDGTTGFVDPTVFCALANFWWRSDNCDTA